MNLRNVEKAWRGIWMRLIGKSLPGPRATKLSDPRSPEHRVLFIRYERIGDMIMATSIIRVLAQASANGKIDVLATPTTAPVLENNPYVGEVLLLDRRSWLSYLRLMAQLRKARYDVMVDGRINNPPIFTSTPLLMLAAGVKHRIGAGGGRNGEIYNICVPEYERSTHYIEGSKALAVPFGVDPSSVDWQPEIFLSDAELGRADATWMETGKHSDVGAPRTVKRLLVNLSASEPKRRWPDEKFSAALQAARQRAPDMAIVVIGLPSEWESVERVAHSADALPVRTPSLRDAFALVGTADMVFTPDTSISHAASAFRKPSLVLLKREHAPYAPYNTPGEVILWGEEQIRQLPYERVSDALLRLVSSVEERGPQ